MKINLLFIRKKVNQNNGYQIVPFKRIALSFFLVLISAWHRQIFPVQVKAQEWKGTLMRSFAGCS